MKKLIEIKNLQTYFYTEAGTVKAVDNVSFDIYEGEGVPNGKKSIAISVTLQPRERTLKDLEIESICKKIISNVVDNIGAVLREK